MRWQHTGNELFYNVLNLNWKGIFFCVWYFVLFFCLAESAILRNKIWYITIGADVYVVCRKNVSYSKKMHVTLTKQLNLVNISGNIWPFRIYSGYILDNPFPNISIKACWTPQILVMVNDVQYRTLTFFSVWLFKVWTIGSSRNHNKSNIKTAV